jgi:GalNAc-alpha-(1->4)-GalNAc-alpha-(1->3)-diNAcBac-PP-undecaprenol alpha-1,4-N-acetyl-D-galactosaminyltransferase
MRSLRQAIEDSRPDAVIAFVVKVNILTVLACVGSHIPVIISERCDPGAQAISRTWALLRRYVYARARALVVQTRGIKSFFSEKTQTRCHIIPNPVIVPKHVRQKVTHKKKTIVGMGRLVEQKGFDLLLRAFAKIAASYPDWNLVIWGQGPLHRELEELALELGLRERATFPGQTSDTHRVLMEADLFVLSSRFEGFPNVLCEAMACGLPVVSFDVPSGPSDIIAHGKNGFLVPASDIDALAKTMDRLLGDENERSRLVRESAKIVTEYGVDKVMDAWERLILSFAASNSVHALNLPAAVSR